MLDQVEHVNWDALAQAKAELGAAFPRILGYFKDDGEASVTAIETAFRARDAVALVAPAHRLKGEAAQFAAYRLSAMAEEIEIVARRCVEFHECPEELIEIVVALRPCFVESLFVLNRAAEPAAAVAPVRRPAPFTRRVDSGPPRFGRATS